VIIHFNAFDYVINNLLQPDPRVDRLWRSHLVISSPSGEINSINDFMTAGDHAAGLRSEKLDPICQTVRRAPALHRVYLISRGST
jgi:hypothetical protein